MQRRSPTKRYIWVCNTDVFNVFQVQNRNDYLLAAKYCPPVRTEERGSQVFSKASNLGQVVVEVKYCAPCQVDLAEEPSRRDQMVSQSNGIKGLPQLHANGKACFKQLGQAVHPAHLFMTNKTSTCCACNL